MKMRFGKWRVLDRTSEHWLCRCACGTEKRVVGRTILRGLSKSCGCAKSTHGKAQLPEFRVWIDMRRRCNNPKHAAFPNYGARGITVCRRWRKFENFYADMGPRPSNKHSIDRVNNRRGYSPKNCAWRIQSEQMRNLRINRLLTFQGVSLIASDWAKELGLSKTTIGRRIKRGWPLEMVLWATSLQSPTGKSVATRRFDLNVSKARTVK